MSLFKALQSALSEPRAVTGIRNDYASTDTFDLTETEGVTTRRVAGYPPVSQALQMISGDCAKIPLQVVKVIPDGVEVVPNHPILSLISLWGRPNGIDTTYDMFWDWFFHCLLWGKSAIWIDRIGPDPYSLVPLLPDRTTEIKYQGKQYFATEFRDDAGKPQMEYLPGEDVLYLEFMNLNKLHACAPVNLYRETFKQAINAQDFTASYFEGGTQQGGILMIPPGASATAIDNVEKQVESKRADRSKWFKSLVLKDGFRWQATTTSLRDATAVELDESTARQVARCYNIPPSKLGLKDTTSYNSLFADNRQYLDSCLSHWLIQGRSQMHRKLLLPSEQRAGLRIDYEIDQLQWADPETKAKIGMLGLQWGFLRNNTVAKWFGERPFSPEELAAMAKNTPEAALKAAEMITSAGAKK